MWDASEALTQYLTKGTKLAVEGKIVNYQYEKDSVTMYGSSVEPLRFGGLEFLGGGSRSDEPRPAPSAEVDIYAFVTLSFKLPDLITKVLSKSTISRTLDSIS